MVFSSLSPGSSVISHGCLGGEVEACQRQIFSLTNKHTHFDQHRKLEARDWSYDLMYVEKLWTLQASYSSIQLEL